VQRRHNSLLRKCPRSKQRHGIVENGPSGVFSCNDAVFLTNARILSAHTGKTRVAVSLSSTVGQLVMSSCIPVSEKMVREVIGIVCCCVPWFCRIIKLYGGGCMSSESTTLDIKEEKNVGKKVMRRKENRAIGGKDVEGLLIFAKKEDGELIGREEVLKEFRFKKGEWERKMSD